ncbi:hypothetical protein DNTS_004115 [Danionella cerebrum]|uniref:Protein odr-4 homolog n=1 Tax=Danionella cerebrum TaxID=2873325 RepID=A0A553MUK0_9TELE|nr:hypothetical protein DNTS_004115 [Danionella translucida]TRY56849.1 hypothetical protein DNTS_004115 [Danionella translucida]
MGRSYFVEEAVEKYLSGLQAAPGSCLTGLLAGQSSPQKDFVVLAVQTPQRESEVQPESSRGGSALDGIDVAWLTEHAKQVSRMLPGGLCILGMFLVTAPELSKDANNTLKRLIFAMEKYVTKGRLWDPSEEDVTDRAALHICSKTKKAVCKTFDVKDPKSSAKPADWKYQTGVSSSWPMLICSVELDLQIFLKGSDSTDKCMKDALSRWAKQIEAGVCLIGGRQVLDEAELVLSQKKNSKTSPRQTLPVRILISEEMSEVDERSTAQVQVCSGSMTIRGVVHCRAYVHNNKPKAKHAAKAIKRDIINTVSSRVEMFLEDLLISDGSLKVNFSSLFLCDYMFPDESSADVAERLKEMLDWETPEEDIDISLEVFPSGSEKTDSISDEVMTSIISENHEVKKTSKYYADTQVVERCALSVCLHVRTHFTWNFTDAIQLFGSSWRQ